MSLVLGTPSPYSETFGRGLTYGSMFWTTLYTPCVAGLIVGTGASFREVVLGIVLSSMPLLSDVTILPLGKTPFFCKWILILSSCIHLTIGASSLLTAIAVISSKA
jgi:hypothetical protein